MPVDTYAPEYTEQRQKPWQAEVINRDYRRTKFCLYVTLVAGLLSGLIFLTSGEKIYAGVFLVVVVAVISLFHTPFALIVLYFFLPVESAVLLSPYFTISKAMGIVVLLSFLFTRLGRQMEVPGPFKALLVFFIFAAASIFWALSPLTTAVSLITLTLHVGLIFILVNTIKDHWHFRLIMWVLIAGTVVACLLMVFGLAQIAGQEQLGRVALAEKTNPNILGGTIVLGLLAGFYIFLERGKASKLIVCFVVPLFLLGILMTQSRAALGTAFLAPAAAFFLAGRGRQRLVYAILIFLVGIMGFGLYQVGMKTEVLTSQAKKRLLTTKYTLRESGRLYIWKRGISFIKEKPVHGCGYRNFHVRVGAYKEQLTSAHNNIISLTAELGFVGLTLAIIFHILLIRDIRRVSHPSLRWICIAFLMSSLLTGAAMTTYAQKNFWYALAFIMLAGTISKNVQEYEGEASGFLGQEEYVYPDEENQYQQSMAGYSSEYDENFGDFT